MVSEATIERGRALVRKALTQTCTISREVAGKDRYGGQTHATETVATDVPCRLIRMGRGRSQLVGEQETLTERYRLVLAYGTQIGVNTSVMVAGETFLVVAVVDSLAQQVDVQVMLEKATNG